MKANNFKNFKNSYNAFNPFYYSQKLNSKKINGNSSRQTIESQISNKRYKNILSRKQAINFNSSQIIKSKKTLNNHDNNNDINNNTINKSNYCTYKTNKVRKYMEIPISNISQSRNFNKLNCNCLSNTIMSSFSLTNDITNYNNPSNKKDYDLDKLKENGIKYCFDEEGNPMDILDIKIKNKKPIAFIIQTAKKNILMDTNDKIISPNNNGDYTLSHIPYIIIHKYDVLHPELRVIKNNDTDNGDNNVVDFKSLQRRKNNKSVNFFDTCTNLNGLNEISENLEKKNDNFKFFSPVIESKINSYKNLNNNIRSQKRKYIFVNRLNEVNKSLQLKLNNNKEEEDNKNNSLIKTNFKNNDGVINGNYLKQKEFFTINNDDKENTSLFDNTANKLISKSNNKLINNKDNIEEKKIYKNLEFKFERTYKSINPLINRDENINSKENEKTPNKVKEVQLLDYFNSIPTNSNINRAKKILLFNQNHNTKLELNKNKRQKRSSYSLNEFMFNPLLNSKQGPKIINKDFTNWNTLSTFNQSLFSPTTEKTTFSTIQKNNQASENNISLKKLNLKNSLKNKYYLKPKIKSTKFFHKRINTENFNTSKNIKFLQKIENENNKINNNYITPFTLTEIDFKTNKNIHDTNCNNNSVCKCPYCHNLFYN